MIIYYIWGNDNSFRTKYFLCLAYCITILRPSPGPPKNKGVNRFYIEEEHLTKLRVSCLPLVSKLRSLSII